MGKRTKFKANRTSYEQDESLEVKTPERSLRSARNMYVAGGITAAVSALAIPVFPALQLAMVPYCLFRSYRSHRGITDARERFRQLGESRSYIFERGEIPMERGPDGKIKLHTGTKWGPHYEPPGVGYDMTEIQAAVWGIDGTITHKPTHRRVMRHKDRFLPIYKKQEAYLEKHHPNRFRAVQRWLAAQHIRPFIDRRYPYMPDCQALRANGEISPELIEAIKSMFGAIASHAARRTFSVFSRSPTIQVSFKEGKPQFTLTDKGRQECEEWLRSKSRVIDLVDRHLALRLVDEGYPSLVWFSLGEGDKPYINPESLAVIQERFDNMVCGYLGIASRAESNVSDWRDEMSSVLKKELGHTSIRSWIESRIKGTRDELSAFIKEATTPDAILKLLTPLCSKGLEPMLKANESPEAWAEAIITDARESLQVEYYEGIRLALQPNLWEDRIETIPRLKAISVLRKQLFHLGDKAESPKDAYPRVTYPVPASVYMGTGFFWDVKHTKSFQDQIAHNLGDLTKNANDYGDPRIYGIGLDDEQEVFLEERIINQHVGIFGASGVGKTRFAEPIVVQAVRSGFGVLILDPKGDSVLVNRVFEEARRHGRGNDVHLFSLASPRNENISTYSCLYNYRDPADLGSRVSSTMPATKDPFWRDVGSSAAKSVCTLSHWMQQFIAFIGRDENGNPLNQHSGEVPLILPALALFADSPNISPAEAERHVRHIRAQMQVPGWEPSRAENTVVQILKNKMYSPVAWTPSMKQVEIYAISKAYTFLAWGLRLVYGHLYTSTEEERRADYPEIVDENSAIAMTSGRSSMGQTPSMWQRYLSMREHPLERRITSHPTPLDDAMRRVLGFYDHFIPRRPAETELLQRIFTGLHEAMQSIHDLASQDSKTRSQHLSTLRSALSRFGGERDRILNSIHPDIVFSRFMERRQIVYIHLASLIDPVGSTGICKVVMADLVSFLGEIEAYRHDMRTPFYLVGDEISSWINDAAIDLLARGRSAGARATLIGQSIPDLEALLGDRAKAQQIIANMSTMIQLRTQVDSDAESFSKRAGQAIITQESRNIGFTPGYSKDAGHAKIEGFSANESRNFSEKETTKVPASALMNLPRGQAFIHSVGGINLVAAGMLPDPEWDTFSEFGILDGTAGAAAMADVDVGFVDNPDYDVLYDGEAPIPPEAGPGIDADSMFPGMQPSQKPPQQVVDGPLEVRSGGSHGVGSGSQAGSKSRQGASGEPLYGDTPSRPAPSADGSDVALTDEDQTRKPRRKALGPQGATVAGGTVAGGTKTFATDQSIDEGGDESYSEDDDLY